MAALRGREAQRPWHTACSGKGMARLKPSVRSTETFTEANFLRLHSAGGDDACGVVTLEHFAYRPPGSASPGWSCQTIVDGEAMSRADAIFIARSYAAENGIPVIYESRDG
jgi:hypothetical protein